MEEIQLLDAVERYILGEMNAEEKVLFNQLRNTNPEVDQMVVSHTLFLKQLNNLGDRKHFKANLQQIHTSLTSTGDIKEITPKAKVVDIFRKYGKVMVAAACIAGIIAFSISGVIAYVLPKGSASEIVQLKQKLKNVERSQNEQKALLSNLQNTTQVKPAAMGKFGGTGFLIKSTGYLVTSAHVVSKADSVYVVNNKGEYFKASVLHANASTDVAILKIVDSRFQKYPELPYTIKKTSADLGESIFTLGFPRTEIVYNEGYLSAKTGYNGDTAAYQIAISANPGNSGGPIFNQAGEVIGVLSGKQTTAEGVVFSSKSKNIFKAIDDLKQADSSFSIKLKSNSEVKGMNRVMQVKKIEDYVFNVMSY
jgi:serine protease Do